ncbi:MFS transporter [Allorhizobium sp. BGMRC 0089]|uniref:YbfB/YjiJ family MFS transporter n=1 Tax=Allorhizobium sonneratiae TaxID=2934936 RepID=UPI002033CFFE|nr:YbfB/YjiJ family MFS transporter [Allorhizobium sonneratiae]MCM2291148.1 MFS transporter [Allorhizobium sonneratiae]
MSFNPSRPVNLSHIALGGAVAMAAAMGFGRFSFTPILPGMMAGEHLDASQAGLIAGGNFLGYLVGAVLAGQRSAHGGERRLAVFALIANAVLLSAMALPSGVVFFTVIRFLAGLASAYAMIFTSSIVLSHAAAHGGERAQSVHFGGVGFGIALSSLMVFAFSALPEGAVFGLAGWQVDWLSGAAVSLLAAAAVMLVLPEAHFVGAAKGEAPLTWSPGFIRLFLSYGLFGFGYVITATFIVAMAKQAHAGPVVAFLAWFLAGLAASVSLFVWRPVMGRLGLSGAFALGLGLEAVGVFASAMLPGEAAPVIGGLLLGATFMIITAYGLRLGRLLCPQSPRKALAVLTAAFGTGQIIGPIVAGAVAQRSGSFVLPSIMAGFVLLVSLALAISLWRNTKV